MPEIRTYFKGENIHCLLASYTHPNIFIPVKAKVKDVKWDSVNPLYKIKIVKFYENYNFLKKYLFDMNFYYEFDKRTRPFKLKKQDFSNLKELQERLDAEDEKRFYVIVDGVMCAKTKADLQILFSKVQYFLVARFYKQLKENSVRSFYKGEFRFDSEAEFKTRLKTMLEGKYPQNDIDSFLDSI